MSLGTCGLSKIKLMNLNVNSSGYINDEKVLYIINYTVSSIVKHAFVKLPLLEAAIKIYARL